MKEKFVFSPLSKKKRQEIIQRDEGKSQLRHYNEDKGWHTGGYCEDGGEGCENLHVHHIKTQRNGGADDPENLITVYQCEHTGYCPDGKVKDEYARKKK